MLKANEIRDQSLDELLQLCQEKRNEQFKIRSKPQQKNVRNIELSNVRKEIARLLTIIAEKEAQQQHKQGRG